MPERLEIWRARNAIDVGEERVYRVAAGIAVAAHAVFDGYLENNLLANMTIGGVKMIDIIQYATVDGKRVPVRPFAVPESLRDLRGPRRGLVDLPFPLDWSSDHRYSLDSVPSLMELYSQLIGRTPVPEALGAYINSDVLIEIWPRLRLPEYVRNEWERRLPMIKQGSELMTK